VEASVDGFLFTVAELAVAFAGFAGLVTVLTRRLTGAEREFDIVRLRDLLLLSLLAAAFALFPELPVLFGAGEDATWRLSSFFLAAAWGTFGIQGLLAGVRLSRSGTHPFSRPLFWSNLVIHVACLTALALVAVDASIVAAVRPAVYATAVFALLYLAGAYFVALFVSLARS
jgi:hypothetical protein